MTIKETEEFYKQDKKEYVLKDNPVLKKWYIKKAKSGYQASIDMDALQSLIEKLAYWYEIKYADREFCYNYGDVCLKSQNKDLANAMSFEQLLTKLDAVEIDFLKGGYHAFGGGIRHIYNQKGQVTGTKEVLFMKINRKKEDTVDVLRSKAPYFLLTADIETGQVVWDGNLEKLVSKSKITLDELLSLFQKNCKKELDYSELAKCVSNHKNDLELREIFLMLVALRLLFSRDTIPEYGYKRAQLFIEEFNQNLGLNISTEEIDMAMNLYKLDNNRQKNSSALEENVNKKGKGLIRILFKKGKRE